MESRPTIHLHRWNWFRPSWIDVSVGRRMRRPHVREYEAGRRGLFGGIAAGGLAQTKGLPWWRLAAKG